MNDDLVLDYVKTIWQNGPGALLSKRSLLVLDSFRCRLTDKVKKQLHRVGPDMAVIPGSLTGMLQPLDVNVNRPFMAEFRRHYTEWMPSGCHEKTPTVRLKRALLATVLCWILSAWSSVSTDIVSRSFKVTGILDSLDGTEDDFLWDECALQPRSKNTYRIGGETPSAEGAGERPHNVTTNTSAD